MDRNNITDSDEERLLADPDGGTTDKTINTEIESTSLWTIHKLDEIH